MYTYSEEHKQFLNKFKKKEEVVEEAKEPETKVCPFCLTDVKYHATRCPHCTSELIEEVEAK